MIGTDTSMEYQMVTEALKVHAANGTMDSPLARRLAELQVQYGRRAKDTGALDRALTGEAFPKESVRKGGQQATGGAPKTSASDKAKDYAIKLMEMKDSDRLAATHSLLHAAGVRLVGGGPIDAKTCSQLIDVLKNTPWRPRTQAPAPVEPKATPEPAPAKVVDGYFMFEGKYVKVQLNQAGTRSYAKVWDGYGWEYAAGLVSKIRPEMALTQEQAAEFGHLYGSCCVCGRRLTDEASIAAGIGPICNAKMGW